MYKVTVQFTRPSTDVPFWQPNASQILHNQENYGFIRNRAISEDGLVMTLDTFAVSQELWESYVAEGANLESREARNAYNEEHGITKEVVFQGEID
jgi:hypothetical protein